MTLSRKIALILYERRWWVPRWLQRLAGVSIWYGTTPLTYVSWGGKTRVCHAKSKSICPTNGVGLPIIAKGK